MKQQQQKEVCIGMKGVAEAVDFVKIAKLKFRLHIIFAMQAVVHLFGLIGLYMFAPNEPYNRVLTFSVVGFGLACIVLGKRALISNHVRLLRFYCSTSEMAKLLTLFLATGQNTMKTYVPEDMQQTADIFFYAHLVLGSGVEVFQILTTGALINTLSPPRKEARNAVEG